jgi:hypothetical protein
MTFYIDTAKYIDNSIVCFTWILSVPVLFVHRSYLLSCPKDKQILIKFTSCEFADAKEDKFDNNTLI